MSLRTNDETSRNHLIRGSVWWQARSAYPVENRPFSLETYGIEIVADEHRHGRPVDLFWLWLAANIGIVAILWGVVAATLGLDLVQAIVVTLVAGAGSFVPVGILGSAGQEHGQPMLALSRCLFGLNGNKGPAFASWASLVGWETITAVVAATAVAATLPTSVRGSSRAAWEAAFVVLFVALSLLLSRLGHATIVALQRYGAWLFGLATLILVAYLAGKGSWSHAGPAHPASFGAVLQAGSVIAASGGISWVNVSADYSRYLPLDSAKARNVRRRAVLGWTVLGATLPYAALVVLGYVLAKSSAGVANATNPIVALRGILPGWATIPYLTVAVAGLLLQMILGLYSSGLSLLALGVRTHRSRTVLLDAALAIGLGLWIVLTPHSFLTDLESLVVLLACPVAAWAAVYLAGLLLERKRPRRDAPTEHRGTPSPGHRARPRLEQTAAFGAWLLGSTLGLLTTSTPLATGPFAKGMFAQSSLGYFAGGAAAAAGYGLVVFACAATGARRGCP